MRRRVRLLRSLATLTLGGAELALLTVVGAVLLALLDWPFSWGKVQDILSDADGLRTLGVWAAVLVALQGALLLPLRRPAPMREKGHSFWLSALVAALLAGGLLAGAVFTALELVPAPNHDSAFHAAMDSDLWWVALLAPLAAGWLAALPLVVAFSARALRETWLGRLSALLFTGSVLELLAVIPVDVMVRRRTDCHCATGTFFALVLSLSVGLAALGPAAAIPLIARRRRRWWKGRCTVCGYPRQGLAHTDRCPECGVGWRDG